MAQSNWRWCDQCQGLFFAGNNFGVCTVQGTHNDAGSDDYQLQLDSGSGQPKLALVQQLPRPLFRRKQ